MVYIAHFERRSEELLHFFRTGFPLLPRDCLYAEQLALREGYNIHQFRRFYPQKLLRLYRHLYKLTIPLLCEIQGSNVVQVSDFVESLSSGHQRATKSLCWVAFYCCCGQWYASNSVGGPEKGKRTMKWGIPPNIGFEHGKEKFGGSRKLTQSDGGRGGIEARWIPPSFLTDQNLLQWGILLAAATFFCLFLICYKRGMIFCHASGVSD